jgi:hypothetical protein
MLPARQDFKAADPTGVQFHHRLEAGLQFVVFDRTAHVCNVYTHAVQRIPE